MLANQTYSTKAVSCHMIHWNDQGVIVLKSSKDDAYGVTAIQRDHEAA